MKRLILAVLCAACGVGGDGAVGSESPETYFTLAASGDLTIGVRFTSEGMSGTRAGDGGDGCEGSWRGVQASDHSRLMVTFEIDGCAVFSEGAPGVIVPARLRVKPSGGEDFVSYYYDGRLGEHVDGCVATIVEVHRWEDSPFHDRHLFLSGTYTCAELFAGHSEGDPVAIVQPGTFTIDWTISEP